MHDANASVGTKEGRASVIWDPLFGTSTTLTIETKGSWSMTVQSLSMAPTWDLGTRLTIKDGNAVFKVVNPLKSGANTTPIAWRATGCPVSTADKRVWNPGGGGINGWWSTELGKKRGASIYLRFIYHNGQVDWLGEDGGSWDSQSRTYSGATKTRGEIVAITTYTNCEELILEVGN